MSDFFTKFCDARVREARHGFPELIGGVFTLKDLMKAYTRWAAETRACKLSAADLEVLANRRFGESKTKTWSNICVFLDDEDVEEFDKRHTKEETLEDVKKQLEEIKKSKSYQDALNTIRITQESQEALKKENEALKEQLKKQEEQTAKVLYRANDTIIRLKIANAKKDYQVSQALKLLNSSLNLESDTGLLQTGDASDLLRSVSTAPGEQRRGASGHSDSLE